ncbi:tol-pal system protein YbgF (plasmid) [Hymenobacter sp. BRD128]|uniref:tol-pal system protein YbgF n=1 Tax=Hymenobacter sp. BRD128 TaxID=2675878 RepID=UPI0015642EB2|nr:tol-pal system protein YbgF [Hymenobacter sp. BRD128]QKG59109.1 tol-pal system protein YbgF [Hymenobacter sp. BRD128]
MKRLFSNYPIFQPFLAVALFWLVAASDAHAQGKDSTRIPVMSAIKLDTVQVGPQAVDTKGWLLTNKDIEIELGGAVHNLYNFKFDKAEKQFRSLRRRYPAHPMAYFLLGLATWWKMMPSNLEDTRYDKLFLAYMDTAEAKATALYRADNANYEASFFLSAAYGFKARFHSERHDWRQATVNSKKALEFLAKSRQANDLSVEFLFGEGLFNYYAVWIGEQYPWLRPILFFFPRGNRLQGLTQLRTVGQNATYTGPEANAFLLLIYSDEREKKTATALRIAERMNAEYPDNSRFERDYAKLSFAEGNFAACETSCRSMVNKITQGLPGYEAQTGRAATYILGWLMQHRHNNAAEARNYYQRCIVFSESAGHTQGGTIYSPIKTWPSWQLPTRTRPWPSATTRWCSKAVSGAATPTKRPLRFCAVTASKARQGVARRGKNA